MKKTTIRIAGFLLAATCVALLASCKNNTAPATKKDDGKKSTPTTPTFDKAKLTGTWRVTNWMGTDMTTGNQAYLFNFDSNSELKIAYCADTTQSTLTVNTRDTKVNCDISGVDTIKSTDLKIPEKPKIALLGDDVLTIKLANVTKTITLVKEQKDSKLEKATKASNPNTVVNAFNQAFFGINDIVPQQGTAFIIDKLNGNPAGKKKGVEDLKVYHVVFSNVANKKIFLTVELKDNNYKSSETPYDIEVTLVLGSKATMKIKADALGLKDATPFTVETKDSNTIITIGKTILTTKDAKVFGVLNAYGNEDNKQTSIENFGKTEV